MSTPRNTELRIVAVSADSEQTRATLRIDADRPVPAPPLSADEEQARRHATVERELDRLHQAAAAEQIAVGQHMNWLIASQAIFIHAFLMVFVVSGMGVAPVSYWLLGGLALTGIVCAAALHSHLERATRSLALLLVQRRAVEMELATLIGRTPRLPIDGARTGAWAGPAFIFVWLGLLAGSAALRL